MVATATVAGCVTVGGTWTVLPTIILNGLGHCHLPWLAYPFIPCVCLILVQRGYVELGSCCGRGSCVKNVSGLVAGGAKRHTLLDAVIDRYSIILEAHLVVGVLNL